ncbi:MAG: endonuclease III domain-containing protein [Streptosporangiaceae bacterium]
MTRTWPPPDPRRTRAIHRRLRRQQGPFRPKPRLAILDELVATVLSQHTSDRGTERAFGRLKASFPSWEQALDAPVGDVADAIRPGGLAGQKAPRIQRILAAVEAREGSLDLSRLHELDDAGVEAYLTALPGVGPKTASCVLVFSMGRAAFPIDTHVRRVAARLGWLPPGATAEQAHRLLGPRVPADIRYELHLALVTHGRTVCRAARPRCGDCPLRDLCPTGARERRPREAPREAPREVLPTGRGRR